MRGGGLSFYKVEPNPKNAWADSPAPTNGIAHAIEDEAALLRKLGSDLIAHVARPALETLVRDYARR